jgi:hypothetical protein
MRRVLLKVRFDHLTPPQAASALRRFFGLELPAGEGELPGTGLLIPIPTDQNL